MEKKTIFISVIIVVLLATAILLTLPSIVLAEPSWWSQMKRACEASGGTAGYYNSFEKQGCICNGKPSGQRTCPSGSSGDGAAVPTDGATDMAEGLLKNNSLQFGKGLLQMMLQSKSQTNTPSAPTQRDTYDAQAAEQKRQAEAEQKRKADEQAALQVRQAKEREAEQERQREQSKQRIMGSLMGVEQSGGDLGLMTEEKRPLKVKTTTDSFGSTVVVPTSSDAPSVGGLQLMMSDGPSEKEKAEARSGFDTKGKLKGAKRQQVAKVPETHPIEKEKELKLLRADLIINKDEIKELSSQLAKLKKSPEPDAAAIQQVQQKIIEKKSEEKEIKKKMKDMTAEE